MREVTELLTRQQAVLQLSDFEFSNFASGEELFYRPRDDLNLFPRQFRINRQTETFACRRFCGRKIAFFVVQMLKGLLQMEWKRVMQTAANPALLKKRL